MKRLLFLFTFLPLFAQAQMNAGGIITMGRNALYYEDYVLSIQYFNQAIEAKPYLYEPYYYRAVAKYYLGDYIGAVSDCSASIERDPFIDDCFRLRAINLVMTGDYEKAAKDYKLLIHRKNDDRDTWYNLVLCQSQLRKFQEADNVLDTMITKWPKYARCYMLKAQIALEKKDTVKASTLIDQTLNIDSFDVDALSAKAMLYMRTDSFSAAEYYYDKAIIQSPRQAGYFLGRAIARYQQRKLRGAMDDYTVAIDLDPDNYPGHYNRGLLRMQVGENNLAIEDFDFVIKKDPHDRLALYNRATLLEKTGNYRAAIRDYTTVLKEYPQFTSGYENRARCYRKIGENANALTDERKVYVARLDEMFGQQKKPKRTTRKEKEQNIDEYKNLVVDDESDKIANFYSSDYRGRVQNHEVDIQPQSQYMFTFNVKGNDVIRRKDYAAFVDKINNTKLFSRKVFIAPRESAVSVDDIKELDAENARITKQIGKGRASANQLFALAFIAASKRDYASALASLDQTLRQDSTFEAALFLRALVKTYQLETQGDLQPDNKNTNATSLSNIAYLPIIKDLTQAIQTDHDCVYFYYNRACLYQKNKQTTEALQDYNKAIELNPDLAEAYYNRGLLYVGMSDYQKGFLDLSKAGELGLYSAYSLIRHFRKQQNQTQDQAK